MLETVGEKVAITQGPIATIVKAIIQPMRYKNKLYLEMDWSNLGLKDSECFLYIGPPDVDFTGRESDIYIQTQDRAFCISRADRIRIGGETVYIWAVLTPKIKENDYDIS